MLFNEPKLLKSVIEQTTRKTFAARFSALQRAEIAEMAELLRQYPALRESFSALQRAEIAEIRCGTPRRRHLRTVSVLFNEPKLLKSYSITPAI